MAEEKKTGEIVIDEASCCRVEAIISVDERGQMVLPKDIRDQAGISPGDKLAVVTWFRDGEVFCLTLIKARDMMGMVQDMLGPMMQVMAKGDEDS